MEMNVLDKTKDVEDDEQDIPVQEETISEE